MICNYSDFTQSTIRCKTRNKVGKVGCKQTSIKESVVWELVADKLCSRAKDFLEAIVNVDIPPNPEYIKLTNRINQLSKVNYDGFLNDKIAQLKRELSNQQANSQVIPKDDLLPFVDRLFFETLPYQEKANILDLWVNKITILDAKNAIAEIEINF